MENGAECSRLFALAQERLHQPWTALNRRGMSSKTDDVVPLTVVIYNHSGGRTPVQHQTAFGLPPSGLPQARVVSWRVQRRPQENLQIVGQAIMLPPLFDRRAPLRAR